jgi:hypothetical protein
MSINKWLVLIIILLVSVNCLPPDTIKPQIKTVKQEVASTTKPLAELPQLARADFNQISILLDLPLFWSMDEENPGSIDPQELDFLGVDTERATYLADGQFTEAFNATYRRMIEQRRRLAVARELNQASPTLILSDFSDAPQHDKFIVKQITAASRIIEELFSLQNGSFYLQGCLPPKDDPSRALFRRNQGPWCEAPKTESDPFCNACPDLPAKISGLYPADLASDPLFCDTLSKHKDAKSLLDPFRIVRGTSDKLQAVPYNQEWGRQMNQIAEILEDAAKSYHSGEEVKFADYLLGAAQGFRTNKWERADEAWAAMNASNSKWYLRIGPDEVYFEPCNRKAGFHVSFAKIDQDSVYWQNKLTPLRQEMEDSLAKLCGSTYQPRKVSVHLPDFIEIILNAGDSRSALGATIGQSLPNWGKVAEEGRGRTVVMSNLYFDPDSKIIRKAQAESLFSLETMKYYTDEKRLSLLDIILHEAAHNFGPHSDYKIDGKRPSEIFGGKLATVLEELKAQTGALYFVDFLVKKGIISTEEANRVYNHAILWAFGHISRGMTTPTGNPKPYSQLGAIQIQIFINQGAISWENDQFAANSKDQGRFTINYEKLPLVIEKLMKTVTTIKASGDLEQANRLVYTGISKSSLEKIHAVDIKTRILRYPKASFVYSVITQ